MKCGDMIGQNVTTISIWHKKLCSCTFVLQKIRSVGVVV